MRAARPSPNARLHSAFTFALLLTLTAASCAAPTPESGEAHAVAAAPLGVAARVERVVDGDTIMVSIADRTETVRLLGIDTPEKAGGPRPAECFGAQASARAAELLPVGTQVLLSRDHESRDQYSRLLAYVHRASDELFVNLAMVQGGYATPLFFAPNTQFEHRFERAADRARRDWIGFWPACGAPDLTLPSQ